MDKEIIIELGESFNWLGLHSLFNYRYPGKEIRILSTKEK